MLWNSALNRLNESIACNSMNRYLLNISYIGTRFRGIQKTVNRLDKAQLDTNTIQGNIELALQQFRPVNDIQTVVSSRTDAGVHALHSTLHVDLQRHDSQPYNTTSLTVRLNRAFDRQKLPIRVLSVQHVPDNFHCRFNALARTYMYRIAVAKNGKTNKDRLKNRNFEAFLPVEELDRCFFLQNSTFDIDLCREASQMFLGRHDFRTFMSTQSRQNSTAHDNPMFTLRTIEAIDIKPGKTLAVGANAERTVELYNYWDIEITGKSFIYKQVRRIVGTLMSVATGRIDKKCVYEMLTVPSKHSWNPKTLLSPPFGLYLCKVHYNENDLKCYTNANA